MRSSLTKRYILYFLIHFSFSYGQNVVQNVDWDINEYNEMVITYTLNPENPDDVYKISISITSDGGRSWFSPKSLEGDLGRQKGYGNKKITWDIFSDVDELEGDVDVEVAAVLHRRFFQKVFITSKQTKKNKNGLGLYVSYPQVDFPNPTYQKNLKDGVIEQELLIGGAIISVNLPYIITIDGAYISYKPNGPIPFKSYSDDDYQYEHGYNIFTTGGEYYKPIISSINYQSFGLSYSYAILPNVPSITPSVGLGFQWSRIEIFGNKGLYDSNANLAFTSDLFISGNLKINLKYIVVATTYKQSLIRELRKWNQFHISLGIHFN